MWLVILFISAGVMARLIPHTPNFAPLAAVALLSGLYCNKRYGYLIPLAIYILSDLILGLHNTVLFTWGSLIIIYFLGWHLRQKKTMARAVCYTILSSLTFFVITNFGVWLMGWYPHTTSGLAQCFINALPFFRISLAADLVYGAVFFGMCEYYAARHKLSQEIV